MRIEPLAVPSGAGVLDVLPALARALEGGAPVAPYAVGSPPPDLSGHDPAGLPDDLAVVVGGPDDWAQVTGRALSRS